MGSLISHDGIYHCVFNLSICAFAPVFLHLYFSDAFCPRVFYMRFAAVFLQMYFAGGKHSPSARIMPNDPVAFDEKYRSKIQLCFPAAFYALRLNLEYTGSVRKKDR